VTGPNDDGCEHKWDSDNFLRVCLECGQLRTFPGKETKEEPLVLWPGKGAEGDPKVLFSRQQKTIIAFMAKDKGLKELAKLTGIPVLVLRGWVGAYCRREPVTPEPAPEVSRPPIQIFAGAAGECAICTGEIQDSPFYLQVGENRRFWLHDHCAQNLAKVLESLGIACELKV